MGPSKRSEQPSIDGLTPVPIQIGTPSGGALQQGARIDLIRPPMVVAKSSLATHGPTPPIGLAYIAAALRTDRHDVAVIDAPGEAVQRYEAFKSPIGTVYRVGLSNQEIVNRVRADTKLIGISVMFFQEWPVVRELVDLLRKRFPTVTIILGGETASAFSPWIFQQSEAVDHIARGEGERTMLSVARDVADGVAVRHVEGLVSRTPDGIEDGGLPTRIRDLAEVARPAWDLFPLQNYWDNPYFGVNRGRSMPVLATRGCPYSCSFCSAPQMWTTRYRVRDPDDLADEIAEYAHKFAVTNINFVDLTAITKRSWTLDYCDALDRRGLDISWQLPIGTRSEVLDEQVLQRLWDTGCRNIAYAPETGSPRMVKVFEKKVDLPHLLASVRTARRIGIHTHISIIIGHPQERRRDLARSMMFMLHAAIVGCDDAAAIMFCPYPGSADFDQLVADGRLPIDEAACYHGLGRSSSAARSFNPRIGATQLRIAQLVMLATFYATTFVRRPFRVVQFFRSLRSGDEVTYLDQMVRSRRMAHAAQDSAAQDSAAQDPDSNGSGTGTQDADSRPEPRTEHTAPKDADVTTRSALHR